MSKPTKKKKPEAAPKEEKPPLRLKPRLSHLSQPGDYEIGNQASVKAFHIDCSDFRLSSGVRVKTKIVEIMS